MRLPFASNLVEYLMLHTLTADLAQLELIAKHVIEPFGGAR